MNIGIICFTDLGEELGNRLCLGEVTRCSKEAGISLSDWTSQNFNSNDALIYIGATGIAVRAIAPHIKSKTTDPAVICIDEMGRFVISLLSGHLGGANDLALEIAERIGATPVVTTATDGRNTFAVDSWAKSEGFGIVNPEAIKKISSAVLSGDHVTITAGNDELELVPKINVLGVGCKRGTSPVALMTALSEFACDADIELESIGGIASIDLKKDEEGLIALARSLKLELVTYSADELNEVPGEFSGSEFVKKTTGVDNVCERSAVKLSGGELIVRKKSYDGITFALARMNSSKKWEWK